MLKAYILRMRRITTSGDYFGAIDGVRLIAILLVFVQHLHERVVRFGAGLYPQWNSESTFATGLMGVHVFFALSGFILYRVLEKPFREGGKPNLSKYYLRRLTRLEPPYIIIATLIFLALVLGVSHSQGKFLRQGGQAFWQSYLATITYTHVLIFGTPPSVNPPGWTLEIEVQFYLLAPLFVLLLHKIKPIHRRVLGILTVVVVWNWLFAVVMPLDDHRRLVHSPRYQMSLLSQLPYFLVGFAVLELRRLFASARPSIWVDIAAGLGLAGAVILQNPLTPLPAAVWQCFCIGLFLYGALAGGWWGRILGAGLVASLGGMCYTLYLIHLPLMEMLVRFTGHVGCGIPYLLYYLIQFCIVIPIVFVVASVFFLIIEQPCMRPNWPRELAHWVRRAFGRKELQSTPNVAKS